MDQQASAYLAAFGPLSQGMAGHILLMNLVAPVAALGLVRWALVRRAPVHGAIVPDRLAGGLALATAVQIALLWGWHAPPVWLAAMETPLLHLAMQASLALAALWFWVAAIRAAVVGGWQPLAALLVTSKLFCLLGVLLTFAPSVLYGATHHGPPAADRLADQQLAGLMMLLACPMTYLLAGVIVAARQLRLFEEDARPDEGPDERPGIA